MCEVNQIKVPQHSLARRTHVTHEYTLYGTNTTAPTHTASLELQKYYFLQLTDYCSYPAVTYKLCCCL